MRLHLKDESQLPLRPDDVLYVVGVSKAARQDDVIVIVDLIHREEAQPPTLGVSVGDGVGVGERLG